MTTQRIVFSNPDGSIGIITPAPNARLVSRVGAETLSPPVEAFYFFRQTEWLQEAEAMSYVEYAESEPEFIARIMEKDVPKGASVAGVHDASEIPEDRTFRNAWVHDGKKPVVHMGRAREIHRNHLRKLRAAKFLELDAAYNSADENGDAAGKKAIGARRQVLRDITRHPSIEAAQTPEELKAAIPKELAG